MSMYIIDLYIVIIIISLIRQVGSNKRKIQIKYKIQNTKYKISVLSGNDEIGSFSAIV